MMSPCIASSSSTSAASLQPADVELHETPAQRVPDLSSPGGSHDGAEGEEEKNGKYTH